VHALQAAVREALQQSGAIEGDEEIFMDAGQKEALEEESSAADLKLANGAFLYVSRAAAKKAAAAAKAQRAEAAAKAAAKAATAPQGLDAFVPFEDLLRPPAPPRDDGSSRERSLKDIQAEEERQYKVKRQVGALLDGASMSEDVAARFTKAVQEEDFEEAHWALLFGSHDRETRCAKADACIMLPRPAEGVGYADDDTLEALVADQGKRLSKVCEVAEMLHLRPVGWAFSYADDEDAPDSMLREGDLACAVALQTFVMKKYGRDFGSKFVTMPVSASDDDEDEDDDDDDDDDDDVGAGASARRCVWETPLTLSKQCIMMAYERALDLTAGSVA